MRHTRLVPGHRYRRIDVHDALYDENDEDSALVWHIIYEVTGGEIGSRKLMTWDEVEIVRGLLALQGVQR